MKQIYPTFDRWLTIVTWVFALGATAFCSWKAFSQPATEYYQPGDTSIRMSTVVSTNAPIFVMPKGVERVETWLTTIKDWVSGALVIITALLGWLAKQKSNKAAESGTIASVLIQEIQKVATKEFKDKIAGAAREAGVGDALHQKVKDETPSNPGVEPRNHTVDLVTNWPTKVPVATDPDGGK